MSARNTLVALALWLVAATALADNMLMARVALKADIVFAYAEASIQ